MGGNVSDDISQISTSILHYFSAVQRRNQDNMASALREHDLKPQEWRLLAAVSERPNQTISELSEIAVIDRTRTSRFLDELARKKLISKASHGGDKRYALIGITAAGVAKFKATLPDVKRVRSALFAGLSDTEFHDLKRMLQILKSNAYQYRFK